MRTALLMMSVSCAFAGEWTKSYTVGGSPELIVRCGDANVDIKPGSGGRVEARLTTKGYEIRAGEVEVIEHQSGGRVDIEIRVPKMQGWNRDGNRSMNLELVLPAQARVRVHTGDGNITAKGINGEIALETGDGNIVAESLAGKLEARTGDGNVRVAGRFDAAAVNTGDGNVELRAAEGSTALNSWRVQSGDGNVKLLVPANIKADFDATTGDGHITSDLPMTLGAGKVGGKQLRGKLNGGGGMFTVRTGDGNIHIAAAR